MSASHRTYTKLDEALRLKRCAENCLERGEVAAALLLVKRAKRQAALHCKDRHRVLVFGLPPADLTEAEDLIDRFMEVERLLADEVNQGDDA